MHGKITTILVALSLVVVTPTHADGPAPVPADFKLRIASYGLDPKPVYTEEVVIRAGKIYVFPSNVKEVTVIDPARSTLDIVDVGRRCQCEVTFATLDQAMVKIGRSLVEAAEKLEKQGGKARIVEAKMARDLFETKPEVTFDLERKRLLIKTPVADIDAIGEPETDLARLALIDSAIVNIARLGAYRSPDDLPPFLELRTLAEMTGARKLRPTSITYLYRLAGPPQKMRRTYQVVPTLTDREIEAIQRINKLREVVPSLRYDQFRLDR